MKEIIQALKSGRPFDLVGSDGWHLLMWNTGAGVVTIGMWRDGQPPRIVDWHHIEDHLDGQRIVTNLGISKLVLDWTKNCLPNGWKIESWVVSGFGDPRTPTLP